MSAPGTGATSGHAPRPPPPPTTATTAPAPASADAFNQGWFSDDSAWPAVALWGFALIVISVGAWLLGRRTRQWIFGPLALLPFLVALYFFYENLARLLPPNI